MKYSRIFTSLLLSIFLIAGVFVMWRNFFEVFFEERLDIILLFFFFFFGCHFHVLIVQHFLNSRSFCYVFEMFFEKKLDCHPPDMGEGEWRGMQVTPMLPEVTQGSCNCAPSSHGGSHTAAGPGERQTRSVELFRLFLIWVRKMSILKASAQCDRDRVKIKTIIFFDKIALHCEIFNGCWGGCILTQ